MTILYSSFVKTTLSLRVAGSSECCNLLSDHIRPENEVKEGPKYKLFSGTVIFDIWSLDCTIKNAIYVPKEKTISWMHLSK
jgi:hypothetical protein